MTKKEKAAIQEITRFYDESTRIADRALEALQGMSREHDRPAWCSAMGNLQQLMGTDSAEVALYRYTDYVRHSDRRAIIAEMAYNLANAQGHSFDLGPQL